MPSKVPQTCPDINKRQKELKQMIKDIEYAQKRYDMNEDTKDLLYAIANELDTTIDVLEDLRRSNSDLRDFGEEQEILAHELQYELDNIQSLTTPNT
jgi:hypothetical protein